MPKHAAAPERHLDDLPFHLARLQLNFRRLGDRTLREEGLGPQPAGLGSVLHALIEEDDCLVGSVVERTHLPNGTVTGILDRLEAQKLIARVDDDADGRAWRIRLTAKGAALRPKLLRRHARVMAVVRATLTAEEIAAFSALADRLTAAMQAYRGRGATPKGKAP